jgi:hypothetical protein
MQDGFNIDFDVSEEHARAIADFNSTLVRLRNRRVDKIDVSASVLLLRSKLAWKLATYQQPVLYRIVMLASGCAMNWNARNLLCSYLAARALIETMALFLEFEHELERNRREPCPRSPERCPRSIGITVASSESAFGAIVCLMSGPVVKLNPRNERPGPSAVPVACEPPMEGAKIRCLQGSTH